MPMIPMIYSGKTLFWETSQLAGIFLEQDTEDRNLFWNENGIKTNVAKVVFIKKTSILLYIRKIKIYYI